MEYQKKVKPKIEKELKIFFFYILNVAKLLRKVSYVCVGLNLSAATRAPK